MNDEATPVRSPDGLSRVSVALDARSYDVVIGGGLIAAAAEHMAPGLKQGRVFIVTDETVASLHLATLADGLATAGIASESFVVPAGEKSKSFDRVADLIDQMLAKSVERGTTIVALGGGVVGDLAGFAASITLRGLAYIQMPTTLLAQVDSSVGGKTGINTAHGKNLVGSFYQPKLVLADTGALDTLPRRELLAGYAEVVKYALISDPAFFAWLEQNGSAVIDGDAAARQHAVETCCRAKAALVAADEREAGARALLNLGHTFAHALEADTQYESALLHGEAVAVGMILAFDLSAALGLCPAADGERVRSHFAAMGLPTSLSALGRSFDPADLLAHMSHDKKMRDGRLVFVLAHGIGQAFLTSDVPDNALHSLLAGATA